MEKVITEPASTSAENHLHELQLQRMRSFYQTGVTRSFSWRKEQLVKLKEALIAHEQELHAALFTDLGKSPEESWVTETGFLLGEIKYLLHNFGSWMQPKPVGTNFLNFPSSSYILQEPLGLILIIGPWNYPLQLLLTPLAAALAAGNCAVLKPSEFAPATAAVMKKIITGIFPPEIVFFVEGDGAEVIPGMMNHFRFDHVFYTGSTTVGRSIYQMAAAQLVPVTLELGGKSPCVVEADANLSVAARRIAMTKFSNAGQMCVAPDYLLIHQSIKKPFLDLLQKTIKKFFGDDASSSYSYGKIINRRQFNRITEYIHQGDLVCGGKSNDKMLFIEPTVIDNVSTDAPVMQQEIFGPVLPVLSFNTMDEALAIIHKNENPLAFYLYTSSPKKEKEWLNAVSAGGACINNSSWHFTNHHLPFGGRGNSGLGAYHGKAGFDTFSHFKSVMKTPTWFDPDLKYPSFKGKMSLFKKVTG